MSYQNKTSKDFLKLVLSFLHKERKDVFAIYIYSLLNAMVYLSLPLGIQAIVSFSTSGVISTSIYVITFFVITGTWIVGYLKVEVMNIVEKIQQKIFVQYSIAYAEKILRIDVGKTNRYYLPELVNRIFDTIILQKGISKILLDIPIETIRIVLGITVLGFYHPWFISFGVLVIALVIIIFKYTSESGIKSSIKESDKKYEVVYWLESIANSVKSIKPYIQHKLHLKKIDEHLESYIENRTHHYKILLFQYKTIIGFKVITTMVMLLLCSYLLINQKINIGAFIAAELVIITIISAVEKLVVSLESYYDVITSFTKLNKLLELPEEASGQFSLPKIDKGFAIECKNVSFEFDSNAPILQQINFTIPANTITLLTGNMASGKSTLLKLLSGIYKPTKGVLLYDNIPAQNYNIQEINAKIGYYDEEHKLFNGTIFENIQLGNHNITIEKINQLMTEWGISNVFNTFPNAFFSEVTDSESKLTYSIRKTIIFLKIFLSNHRLIILEEPLQGMNEAFCNHFIPYLKKISTHKNIIIVSNDSSLNAIADNHLHIKNGMITIIK